MSDQNTQEPTMEEILASIRRIISEDEPAEASAEAETASSPHGDDEEDVLELTQRIETAAEPEAEPDSMFDMAEGPQTSGDLEIYERPAARSAPAPAYSADDDFDDADDEEPLVSAPTAATASSAFGQLARTVTMPAEGRSLEDVVRELLRPLLKDWLDQNLPGIVETAVEAEVERISRRRFS